MALSLPVSRLIRENVSVLVRPKQALLERLESDADASALFGDPSISVEAFDRWWTIERFVLTHSTENIAQAVPYQKRNIATTGNGLVDAWIARAIDAR